MKILACSRRWDSGARAKNKASERAGKKNEGRLSERLEQAMKICQRFTILLGKFEVLSLLRKASLLVIFW